MGKEGEGWDRESGLCRGFGLSAYAVLLCIDHRGPAVRLVPWNTHYEWDTHYEARAPFRVVAETQRCRTGVRAFFLLQFNREGGATRLAKATRKSISPRFARSCSGTYLLTGNIRQVHIYPAR